MEESSALCVSTVTEGEGDDEDDEDDMVEN